MLKLDWNIIFNMINVLVLYLLMKRFLFVPVTEIMEKRKNAIEASFADSENKNQEAIKIKLEYEEALKNAEVEAVNMMNEAKNRSVDEYEKQMKLAKEDTLKMFEDAKKSIELERKLSMQNMQAEIATIAMLAATKVIQKNMDDTSNNKILNDFLSEAGVGR